MTWSSEILCSIFWQVGPVSNAGKVTASGRGLQPHGLRALEPVDFKVRALLFARLTFLGL